eukprot:Seg3667.3 transcript_id=Seg3667.3/GoldUCD/mRNA.D3Y31 product="Interleukin-1 receptor-associated kinase 1-binding protein 1" protein_id=Seg3667.3/GoldUCD/D3Y31
MSNQWFSPAKIYAELHKDEQKAMRTATPEAKMVEEAKTQHKVIVTETGDAVLQPDVAKVSILYKSTKETVEAVKHSVQRRIDYILQSLRNNGVKETHYTIHKTLERIEDNFQMTVEICVEFRDFKVCENVCNFLVEKLDGNVNVSRPIFSHSPGKLDALRRQACVNAVKNARSKAEAIAQFVNQKIAATVEVKEEEISEVTGAMSADHTLESGIKGRIEAATITVTVKISATFEIEPKTKKKHRS